MVEASVEIIMLSVWKFMHIMYRLGIMNKRVENYNF